MRSTGNSGSIAAYAYREKRNERSKSATTRLHVSHVRWGCHTRSSLKKQ